MIRTNAREEIIDITDRIKPTIKEGLAYIFVPHTTAAITINESADPDVKTDFLHKLRELIPNKNFLHAEGNSDAHIKSSLVGSHIILSVKDYKLELGRWQSIWFCEFDGPRDRELIIRYR